MLGHLFLPVVTAVLKWTRARGNKDHVEMACETVLILEKKQARKSSTEVEGRRSYRVLASCEQFWTRGFMERGLISTWTHQIHDKNSHCRCKWIQQIKFSTLKNLSVLYYASTYSWLLKWPVITVCIHHRGCLPYGEELLFHLSF